MHTESVVVRTKAVSAILRLSLTSMAGAAAASSSPGSSSSIIAAIVGECNPAPTKKKRQFGVLPRPWATVTAMAMAANIISNSISIGAVRATVCEAEAAAAAAVVVLAVLDRMQRMRLVWMKIPILVWVSKQRQRQQQQQQRERERERELRERKQRQNIRSSTQRPRREDRVAEMAKITAATMIIPYQRQHLPAIGADAAPAIIAARSTIQANAMGSRTERFLCLFSSLSEEQFAGKLGGQRTGARIIPTTTREVQEEEMHHHPYLYRITIIIIVRPNEIIRLLAQSWQRRRSGGGGGMSMGMGIGMGMGTGEVRCHSTASAGSGLNPSGGKVAAVAAMQAVVGSLRQWISRHCRSYRAGILLISTAMS